MMNTCFFWNNQCVTKEKHSNLQYLKIYFPFTYDTLRHNQGQRFFQPSRDNSFILAKNQPGLLLYGLFHETYSPLYVQNHHLDALKLCSLLKTDLHLDECRHV